MEKFEVDKLPLSGRHLIEASAGTGKTYNITHIFLRLLLEKKLTVQQILIVTFTKAATEELRTRIDKVLRDNISDEEKIAALAKQSDLSSEEVKKYLHRALVNLDQASIFTIHGFCHRVLKQYAFLSNIPFECEMSNDLKSLVERSVYDWYRKIIYDEGAFPLLEQYNKTTPVQFAAAFYSAINSEYALNYLSTNEFLAQKRELLTQWEKLFDEDLEGAIIEYCLNKTDKKNPHKPATQDKISQRHKGYKDIKHWLGLAFKESFTPAIRDFIHGRSFQAKNEPTASLISSLKALSKKQSCFYHELVAKAIASFRVELKQQKIEQQLMDYNDLIRLLSQTLKGPKGDNLMKQLRRQFPVALVDEFQDTDQEQYDIFSTIYPAQDEQHLLCMIGDPKQAIYSFRGGDIYTYLRAREDADTLYSMEINWRSSEPMIDAYNALFSASYQPQSERSIFLNQAISYQSINFSNSQDISRFYDQNTERKAMNYVYFDSDEELGLALQRENIAKSMSLEIARLLQQAQINNESMQANDIAILVRTKSEADIMQHQLRLLGLPSVYLSNRETIYESNEAKALLLVLNGIYFIQDKSKVIAALSSYIIGGNAARIASLQDEGTASERYSKYWQELNEYRELWLNQGVFSLLIYLVKQKTIPEATNHERCLTNLLHLTELLQQAEIQHQQPECLIQWLAKQCNEPHKDGGDENIMRLESESNLIKVVTLHGSKGLEYPVVFLPFVGVRYRPMAKGELQSVFISDSQRREWVFDKSLYKDQLEQDENAEKVRLLYVGITRAIHRCYIGFSEASKEPPSSFEVTVPQMEDTKKSITQRVEQIVTVNSNNSVLIKSSELLAFNYSNVKSDITKDEVSQIKNNPLDDISDHWQMCSYSSLARQGHSYWNEKQDDIFLSASEITINTPAKTPDIQFGLARGAKTGLALHDFFEQIDFAAKDFKTVLLEKLYNALNIKEVQQQSEVMCWLQGCLKANLRDMFDDQSSFSLSDIKQKQTMRESEFYFPLHNGNQGKVLDFLVKCRGGQLSMNTSSSLQGMLKGFIDLVFEYQGRYYVADYKSNYMGDSHSDYSFDALKQNIIEHDYDLQYWIYSLALHRYLQSRMKNYSFKQHFGGVYYLYLRGMSAGRSEGVYHYKIEQSKLEQLSLALCGSKDNNAEGALYVQ